MILSAMFQTLYTRMTSFTDMFMHVQKERQCIERLCWFLCVYVPSVHTHPSVSLFWRKWSVIMKGKKKSFKRKLLRNISQDKKLLKKAWDKEMTRIEEFSIRMEEENKIWILRANSCTASIAVDYLAICVLPKKGHDGMIQGAVEALDMI